MGSTPAAHNMLTGLKHKLLQQTNVTTIHKIIAELFLSSEPTFWTGDLHVALHVPAIALASDMLVVDQLCTNLM